MKARIKRSGIGKWSPHRRSLANEFYAAASSESDGIQRRTSHVDLSHRAAFRLRGTAGGLGGGGVRRASNQSFPLCAGTPQFEFRLISVEA